MICKARHSLVEFQNNFNEACGCDTEHMKGLYLLLSPQSLFLQHLFSAPGFTFKIFYIKKNDFDPNFFLFMP